MMKSQSKQRMAVRMATPLALIGLLWVGMTSMDWVLRFTWFHWDRMFFASAAQPRYMGDAKPLSVVNVEPKVGGDLAQMLGPAAITDGLAVEHPGGYQLFTDEYGLPNVPPTTGTVHQIVLAGDSYFLQGEGMSNTLGGRLSRLLEKPVYTVAHAGRGPVYPLSGALIHPYFRAQSPKVLVWGLAERDATGFSFDGMAVEVMSHVYHEELENPSLQSRILWKQLSPAILKKQLPNTSAVAQMMRKAWARVRPAVTKTVLSDVAVSSDEVAGHRLLFYRENLKALFWTPQVRDVPRAKRAAHYAQKDYFKARGIEWIILLIPEKEQVYREHVPVAAYPVNESWPPSVFDALEPALREEGIHVVNLLPVFREAVARGELIYWPDDTHWNERGIQLAAETLAREIGASNENASMQDP